MSLQDLARWADALPTTPPMPVLFVGHGSPMNAITDTSFSRTWRSIGQQLPRPTAILCISAHWETRGTHVTAMAQPRTIHDFGGFPPALYQVQYPAPGSPAVAGYTQSVIHTTQVGLDDHEWGLDHGCWSILRHLYPQADVPVLQLSLDHFKDAHHHLALARELRVLRQRGVLILGSGNMVHNLRLVDWARLDEVDYAFDWAAEASSKMKQLIQDGNVNALADYRAQGRAFDLAIPTPEHYLPLLYALGAAQAQDALQFFNDQAVGGALTMTSVLLAQQ